MICLPCKQKVAQLTQTQPPADGNNIVHNASSLNFANTMAQMATSRSFTNNNNNSKNLTNSNPNLTKPKIVGADGKYYRTRSLSQNLAQIFQSNTHHQKQIEELQKQKSMPIFIPQKSSISSPPQKYSPPLSQVVEQSPEPQKRPESSYFSLESLNQEQQIYKTQPIQVPKIVSRKSPEKVKFSPEVSPPKDRFYPHANPSPLVKAQSFHLGKLRSYEKAEKLNPPIRSASVDNKRSILKQKSNLHSMENTIIENLDFFRENSPLLDAYIKRDPYLKYADSHSLEEVSRPRKKKRGRKGNLMKRYPYTEPIVGGSFDNLYHLYKRRTSENEHLDNYSTFHGVTKAHARIPFPLIYRKYTRIQDEQDAEDSDISSSYSDTDSSRSSSSSSLHSNRISYHHFSRRNSSKSLHRHSPQISPHHSRCSTPHSSCPHPLTTSYPPERTNRDRVSPRKTLPSAATSNVAAATPAAAATTTTLWHNTTTMTTTTNSVIWVRPVF